MIICLENKPSSAVIVRLTTKQCIVDKYNETRNSRTARYHGLQNTSLDNLWNFNVFFSIRMDNILALK